MSDTRRLFGLDSSDRDVVLRPTGHEVEDGRALVTGLSFTEPYPKAEGFSGSAGEILGASTKGELPTGYSGVWSLPRLRESS